MLFFNEIAEARDLAKKKFQLTLELKRSSEGVYEVMNASMNAIRVKLDSSLAKHLCIADPSLDLEFLAQVKKIMPYALMSHK